MVVFAAVRELTEVEADECDGLDLKIVPGKRDQNYMCMNTPGTTYMKLHMNVVPHIVCCSCHVCMYVCILYEDEVCTQYLHTRQCTPSPNFNQPKLQVYHLLLS